MLETAVNKAAETIMGGGSLLYPTDTIWGIGCDATNESAIEEIFRIKRRPDRKSMLVLVNDAAMLERYIENLPPVALDLLNRDERPTTIIYPDARNLPRNLVAEDGSIGIRLCRDPFCTQLIERCGIPLVSTSANLSGDPPPGNFSEINPLICREVDYVAEWRREEEAKSTSSTIVKLEKDGSLTILRP